MRTRSVPRLGVVSAILSSACFVACAVGSTDDALHHGFTGGDAATDAEGKGDRDASEAGSGGHAGTANDAGGGGAGHAGSGGSSGGGGSAGSAGSSGGDGGDGSVDGGDASDASDAGGGGGDGSGDAGDEDGSGGAGGTEQPDDDPACESPNACANATELPSIAGDQEADVADATGSTSQWFRIYVREDYHAPLIGRKLRVTITLDSPEGANYDLYAYFDENSAQIACGSPSGESRKPAGQQDTVSLVWGEEEGVGIPNASDDSRWVSIEVRRVSGSCDASAPWTLTVYGHQ